jgi:hypothetical protein
MLSLVGAAQALRRVNVQHPFELVIISNNLRKFEAALTHLGVPVRYVNWTNEAVHRELAGAAAALLTTGDDRFSRVKSANRAVLALAAGTPVVAPFLPALEPLKGCTATDIEKGLRRYLADPAARAADVARAQAVIEQTYGLATICDRWQGALREVITRARARHERRARRPKLLFLIDLIQDLDVLAPVIDAAQRRGLACNVIVSERAARESPRVIDAFVHRKIIPSMIDDAVQRLDARWLRDSDVLITAAETSLPPHRIAHELAGLANAFRLRTASVQHGYEAPGITYALRPHPQIASQTIFTWREPEDLPPSIPDDVRRRCVGVGRASVVRPHLEVGRLARPPRPVVGVFENLHWERYTNDYRRAFIDHLQGAAEDRPDVTFMVRTHPAGRWFLEKGPVMRQSNVVVIGADGEPPDARPIGELLRNVTAVITTPSTVAVDGCEAEIPTAVFQGDLKDLSHYEPLPRLRKDSDWLEFLAAAETDACGDLCREFLKRVTLPRDGADVIIDHLCAGDRLPALSWAPVLPDGIASRAPARPSAPGRPDPSRAEPEATIREPVARA